MNLHFMSNGVHRVISIDNDNYTHQEYLAALKGEGWVVDDNRLMMTFKK